MDGQGAQILQQVGTLLAQLAQQEPEPSIQRAIVGVIKQLDPLMTVIGANDTQDMTSGLNNPTGPTDPTGGMGAGGGMGGPPPPDPNSPPGGGGMGGPPPDMGAMLAAGPGGAGGGMGGMPSSEGPPKSFGGAKEAAMANFHEKGHFGKGPKGEEQETDKTKARKSGRI